MLHIEKIPIEQISEYANNAKRHPKKQIERIKKSIEEFGFNDPLAVDENNMLIEGHGRLKALKALGYTDVECIRLTGLTEQQKKAYILAHNKLNMETGFDDEILFEELQDITDFNMEDLGFDLDKVFNNAVINTNADKTQDKVEGILNLNKACYSGVGNLDIPEIYPVKKLKPINEWISFNYVMSDTNPTGKAVHFFIDDYQFERVWNNPDKYVDKLKQYVCVTAPDFSPYGDMPLICQAFNHYRKHWVARYLQEHGVTVIPTIRASTDERSLDFYLQGEPHNSIVCISNMWTKAKNQRDYFLNKEYKTMVETLKPTKVFVYGKPMEELTDNIEYIKTTSEKRFNNG